MYEVKEFNIPDLKGISQKSIEEHLKLYAGYTKNTNMILNKLSSEKTDSYEARELHRRLSFEYNGMKNHEYYFQALENGPTPLDPNSELYTALENEYGSHENWLNLIKDTAKTRGVGWAVLGYDQTAQKLLTYWVEEQHFGHLNSIKFIFGIDMWEHAYVGDYWSSGKANYINDYLDNVNWNTVANNFKNWL